ncbi:hypothetical protein [Buttiauxella ferragutiae]|jgi:hypothetical protein|uniref:hypothetical protein n=1 Tax=Buttiauxella ferragutiae TaxID=82989 RepID=UPI001F53D6AF|nr:hypothetical protein [Buttiauxella ferragutiae]UNK60960.1 hypothetical protein MNO13_21880 [Buttiauxella ferragutiae]
MADANSNTAAQSTDHTFPHLADTDVLYSDMANAISAVNLDSLTSEEALDLASQCEESIAGLCHTLRFIGKSFVTFADSNVVEFSQETLCQVGHGIAAISSLIPVLHGLERKADACCLE